MRLLGGLLAAGLSTMAAGSSTPSRDFSSVYYSKTPALQGDAPTLTKSQLDLALAHRLGLSQFHTLDSQSDIEAITKLDSAVSSAEFLGEGERRGKVLVELTNVQTDFGPHRSPTFNVKSKSVEVGDSIITKTETITGYMAQSISINVGDKYDTENLFTAHIVSPNQIALQNHPVTWSDFVEVAERDVAAKFDSTNPKHIAFALRYAKLEWLYTSATLRNAISSGDFVYISFHALNLLEPGTKAYTTAVDLVSNYFISTLFNDPITIITTPSLSTTSHPLSNELKKRKEIPLSIISSTPDVAPSPNVPSGDSARSTFSPFTRFPHFFDSQEKCESQTSHCCSHGSCVKSDFPEPNHWVCKCNATETKTKNGIIRTYWTGNACQKQDISVQFHLIFLFTLLMVGAIAAAISAMLNMGGEELPGVLTAGMVNTKRK
ncbi:hypothetical protein BDZ91DRAFT_781643 [Kalaharituber pfeilii]|nr:hypothetical protein BDZ91DRAFT_781643 [Kalaharituber pfeilii]